MNGRTALVIGMIAGALASHPNFEPDTLSMPTDDHGAYTGEILLSFGDHHYTLTVEEAE